MCYEAPSITSGDFMKKTILAILLLLPVISHAIGPSVSTGMELYTSEGLSTKGDFKEASQVIADSQEYIVSGNISILLSTKLHDKTSLDNSLSLEEALDLIVLEANTIIKE
jgi:hypothetical protein